MVAQGCLQVGDQCAGRGQGGRHVGQRPLGGRRAAARCRREYRPAPPPPPIITAVAGSMPCDRVIPSIAVTMRSVASPSTAEAASCSVETEWAATRRAGARLCQLGGDRHLAAEEVVRVDVAEQQAGVGHGRAVAAASVARRSRLGTRALRARRAADRRRRPRRSSRRPRRSICTSTDGKPVM